MISVVVVTYNRKLLLKMCLDSLLNQDFNEEYEIIIIDNSSCDGITEEFFKKEHYRRIKFVKNNMKLNLASCKHLGVKLALGDIIAFIDDDCIADKNWLKVIKDSLIKYDFIGGSVMSIPDTKFPWWWRNSLDWLVGVNPKPNKKFLPLGSNIAFKKYVFDRLQEDEKYNSIDNNQYLPYAEDNYRVKKALTLRFSMKINVDMIVYHHIPQERLKISYLTKRSYNEGCSWVVWERNAKTFIISLIALVVSPVRFLLSWDIGRFFRIIARISYIVHYIKKRQIN